ncbi:hypothetical protein [Streptomyces microflavus]|uniref:hypothetical protein n=1 Tax=Streptomyces microflavus TaxID=1919 RepID=UPI0033FB6741
MPTSPTPADRPAEELRAAAELLREASIDATEGPWTADHPAERWGETKDALLVGKGKTLTTLDSQYNGHLNADYIALMHPGVGLALAAWLDREAEIWQVIDDASAHPEETGLKVTVGASTHVEALAVARQLLGTTECTCGTPGVGNYEGPQEDCPQHGVRPPYAELTAEEAREMADELNTELYQAQDALAFVGECCDIADREQRPVTTGDVREWLKGARCGRQLLGTTSEDDRAATEKKLAALQRRRDEVGAECRRRGRRVLEQSEQILTLERTLDEVRRQLGQEILRAGEAEAALNAAPPAPADRAAVLREAAEVAAAFRSDCQNCVVELEVAASLRRLADDAAAGVQPPTTEAGQAAEIRRLGDMVTQYGHGASALTDKLRRVRDAHRETCPLATGAITVGFSCGMCELLDAPALPVEPAEPPTHLPKGTNPDYPFLCPGPPAAPAAPEEPQ